MKKSLGLIIFVLWLPLLAFAFESDSFKNLAGSREEMDAMRLPREISLCSDKFSARATAQITI